MSILSDSQIRAASELPSLVVLNQLVTFYSNKTPEFYDQLNLNQFGSNDWIAATENCQHLRRHGYEYRPLTVDERENWKPMISPFVGEQVKKIMRDPTEAEQLAFNNGHHELGDGKPYALPEGATVTLRDGLQIPQKVVSYGLSSYGYDVRLTRKFKIFTNVNNTVIDPLDFDENAFVDFEGDVCIIPPNSFVLAASEEYFNMPADVTGLVLGKSTLARCGCSCLATPLEAGWSGQVTLEFANTTPLPMKLYAGQGAAQVLFFQGSMPAEVSYATRSGKYQGQTGITLPKG
jgi:dCTP deaminase